MTIRTHERRLLWMFLIAGLGVIAFDAPWAGPQWLQHLPARLANGYLASIAILVLAGLWRAWRMALYVDDGGVTVRNLLRSHRFSWPEVARFADGAAVGGQSQVYWALSVVARSGEAVTAAATTGSGVPRPELLTAIRQAAGRYGVPAELTGRRPPARGFYLDPGGQPGVRYFGGKTWSPLLPAEAAGSRQPDTLTGPVPWHLPEAGTWQAGRKAVRDFTARLVLYTAATVVLLASAAGIATRADGAAHHKAHSATGFLYWAAFFAFGAFVTGSRLRLWRRLNRAATEAAATARSYQIPAPVTGNPVTGSARRQAQEHRDSAVQAQQTAPTEDKPPARPRDGTDWIVAGVFVSLIIAYPLVLEVHAAFAAQGSPDYQTPGDVVGNLAIWGLLWLVGPAIAIRGIRRRRRFNADRQTTTRHIR